MTKNISSMVSAVLAVACVLVICAVQPAEGATTGPLRCSGGFTPSVSPCQKQVNSAKPISGQGYCCSCPPGSWSDGKVCRRCLLGAVSADGSQCNCLPGYGDYDLDAQTCRSCASNTYSTNNICKPCAAGTYSAAKSASCAAVNCPLDSYLPPGGSTLADCTRCKFGTAGQSCSTVQACRCLSGYAGFDKTSGQCQQCIGNSIAVYADMVKQDETATVCAVCPMATVASTDKRTCNSATVTVSPTSIKDTQVVKETTTKSTFPTAPIPAVVCIAPVVITSSPSAITATAGKTATFSVTATGYPTPSYQWTVSTDLGKSFSNVKIGGTTNTYTFTADSSMNTYQYQVIVTNSVNSVTTKSATLTVQSAPVITSAPTGISIISGQTATFSVTATGNPAPTYQWAVSTDLGKTFTNVMTGNGGTANSYSFTADSSMNAYQYQVVVTNSIGSVNSAAVILTVTTSITIPIITLPTTIPTIPPIPTTIPTLPTTIPTIPTTIPTIPTAIIPTITLQPLPSVIVPQGAPIQLSVTAFAMLGGVNYQWQVLTLGWTNAGNILQPGVSSTYTPSSNVPGTYQYRVIVSNAAGSVTSSTATVVVVGTVIAAIPGGP